MWTNSSGHTSLQNLLAAHSRTVYGQLSCLEWHHCLLPFAKGRRDGNAETSPTTVKFSSNSLHYNGAAFVYLTRKFAQSVTLHVPYAWEGQFSLETAASDARYPNVNFPLTDQARDRVSGRRDARVRRHTCLPRNVRSAILLSRVCVASAFTDSLFRLWLPSAF